MKNFGVFTPGGAVKNANGEALKGYMMKLTKINGEYEIWLPEHRANRPEWNIKNGGWEKERLASMKERIQHRNSPVVYYIGNEEGDMSALCQMWGASMVLVEPNEKVWPNTKAIWEANKLTPPLGCFVGFAANADIFPSSHMNYNRFPACADGPIISDHGFKELHDRGDIPQVKIDTLVQMVGIVPDFLSIDVEGSEFEVLRGAEKTLREHRPIIWLSVHPEFMFANWKEYSGDLRQWVKDLGYKEEILAYSHELHLRYAPI